MIAVVQAGLLTTVQDFGRPGYAHLGVPRAGAADRDGLVRANRLVGNPADAAALEVTALGPLLRFEVDATVAVHDRTVFVPAGGVVDVGPVRGGLRTYVAVRGGVDVAPVLGSRSTCTLSGLGPPPLRPGDRLPIGRPPRGEPRPVPPRPLPDAVRLRLLPGPRDEALTGSGQRALVETTWTVSADSDRTGLRLAGPPLDRAAAGELPSEGLVVGAVQIPPDGRPVLFLPNHPTTGGYPVVGVVVQDDLWLAAQVAPGQPLRFGWVDQAG